MLQEGEQLYESRCDVTLEGEIMHIGTCACFL